MRDSVKNFIYEWLGKKRSKRHIENEFKRHYGLAIRSSKYIFALYALFAVYYATRGVFIFDLLAASFLIYLFSSLAPDIFYLVWKVLRNDRSYVPSEKRIYSHRLRGMLAYSAAVFLVFLPAGALKAGVLAFFAFLGYWVHLTTDRIELVIDRAKRFVERSMKE